MTKSVAVFFYEVARLYRKILVFINRLVFLRPLRTYRFNMPIYITRPTFQREIVLFGRIFVDFSR